MKKIMTLSLALLLVGALLCGAAFADADYVIDNEGLLTAQEYAQLNAEARRISDLYACSVCILTVSSFEGKDSEHFAEDYYDQNGLGYHGTNDGILLVLSMGQREYYVTSAGAAEIALMGSRLDTLRNAFVGYLSDGDVYGALQAYLRQCDYQLAHRDDPLDDEYADAEPVRSTPARVATGGVLAAVIGFLGSLLPVGSMKRQNNNVAQKESAQSYVRDGSLMLRVQQDRFLRAETNRVRIQTDNAARGGMGGGGSSHISSGGVSHTGGGGKF